MSEHTEKYRRETAELPEDKQLEALRTGWQYAADSQRAMGFSDTLIARGLAAFLASRFPSRASAAFFFACYAADLRREDQDQQQERQTIQ